MKRAVLLASFIVVIILTSHCVNCASVPELNKQIRSNANQMEDQVQTSRKIISSDQLQYLSQAVVLLNDYKQLVLDEKEQLLAVTQTASAECLEALPKPLHSILKTADWSIEMCIGHMAVYGGGDIVEETERQINEFNGIASRFPISAVQDLFLTTEWNTADGLAAMKDVLRQRMQFWDNVSTMEMFRIKSHVTDRLQSMAANDWPLCVNYGQREVQKLFAEAKEHLEECARGGQLMKNY